MMTLTEFLDLPLKDVEELIYKKCKGDSQLLIKKLPRGNRGSVKRFFKFLGIRGSIESGFSRVRKKLNRYGINLVLVRPSPPIRQWSSNKDVCCTEMILASHIPRRSICVVFTKDCKISRIETGLYLYIPDIDFSKSLGYYLTLL